MHDVHQTQCNAYILEQGRINRFTLECGIDALDRADTIAKKVRSHYLALLTINDRQQRKQTDSVIMVWPV
jgi:hypothetical protein